MRFIVIGILSFSLIQNKFDLQPLETACSLYVVTAAYRVNNNNVSDIPALCLVPERNHPMHYRVKANNKLRLIFINVVERVL